MKQQALTPRPLGLLAALLLMLLLPASLAYGANKFVPIENMVTVNRYILNNSGKNPTGFQNLSGLGTVYPYFLRRDRIRLRGYE